MVHALQKYSLFAKEESIKILLIILHSKVTDKPPFMPSKSAMNNVNIDGYSRTPFPDQTQCFGK